jgi:hypothetical protein
VIPIPQGQRHVQIVACGECEPGKPPGPYHVAYKAGSAKPRQVCPMDPIAVHPRRRCARFGSCWLARAARPRRRLYRHGCRSQASIPRVLALPVARVNAGTDQIAHGQARHAVQLQQHVLTEGTSSDYHPEMWEPEYQQAAE